MAPIYHFIIISFYQLSFSINSSYKCGRAKTMRKRYEWTQIFWQRRKKVVFSKEYRYVWTGPKTVLDSGFHAVDFRFQVLDSGLYQWNLHSGFRTLVGFRIPRAKISRIPQSGFPYMEWNLPQWPCIHCSRPKALSWRRSVGLFSLGKTCTKA